jgi:hypothetical protein
LALTTAYFLAGAVAGWLTGSLALLADAGHMLTDVAGLALALFAIHIGERLATPERTYGYYRTEILAALANGIVLVGISVWVLVEAYERIRHPQTVASLPMLLVALVGLSVNAGSIWLLRSASGESVNLKGAYFEVLSDAISSVGVVAKAPALGREILHDKMNPIPSAGTRLRAVWHGAPSRAQWPAQEQSQIPTNDVRERRQGAGQPCEAEVLRLKGHGGFDVVHPVANIDGCQRTLLQE